MKGSIYFYGINIIAQAIIWGAVIIGCSAALKGTGMYDEIKNILIGGTVVSLFLANTGAMLQVMKMAKKEDEAKAEE